MSNRHSTTENEAPVMLRNHSGMDDLSGYINQIIVPTFEEFRCNPRSGRHAYLACVATFHAVDRAKKGSLKPASLRQKWRKESFEFLIVDMIAHHLKHVRSSDERGLHSEKAIPLSSAVFDYVRGDPEALNLDLHNLQYLLRDAICFIRKQA
jgi:hypothetical protein